MRNWGGGSGRSGGGGRGSRGGGGRGRIGGGNDSKGGRNCKFSGGKALEGPSRGSSEQGSPEHTFLAALSPLLLLLFKFVAVSIGVSNVSVVMETIEVETCLLLAFFLALVTGGCSVMCAGMGAVSDLGIYTVVGVVIFVEAGSMSFAGKAAVDLSSAFWGEFFFFRVTSIHSSTVLGWAWSGSFPVVVSLMVAVETVVTTVSVATVAATAAGAFGGSLLGQNFDICPNCLQH